MAKAPQPPKGDDVTETTEAPVKPVAPKAAPRNGAKRIDYNDTPAPDAPPVAPPQAKPIRVVPMSGGSVRHDY